MNHCPHGYLIPPDLAALSSKEVARVGAVPSPHCFDCWAQPELAELLASKLFDKPTCDEPCLFGFCDLIAQIVRKRAWARDSFAREAKESDLRTRLIEQRTIIEKAIAGKDRPFVENYVRRVLKNKLTNDQSRGESLVVRNSFSLSECDGLNKNYRRQASDECAGRVLVDATGGESASLDDDRSLDKHDVLVAPEPGNKKQSDAKQLFDALQAEALSQISTLTGGRKDGFDTHLDLEKALSKLPEDEHNVFSALFLENGVLLNRPRTYSEAEFLTGLSLQTVRTLEKKAVDKLRPVLSPSFFKKRTGR
jgi:hypothetical protein